MNQPVLAEAAPAPGVASPTSPSTRPDPIASTFGTFERLYYLGEARSSDTVCDFALDHLRSRLDEKRYAILSLDVFDTLMLRNVKCERRRFWEIAERWHALLPQSATGMDVLDLYLARRRAAQICYSCGPIVAGTQEGRFDSLIGVTLSLLKLPQSLASSFIAAEIDYEVENLAPNPVILRLLDHYGQHDGKVMLLSDMYLSGAQIYTLISHFGLSGVAPYVYSSADITLNKRSGTIFHPAAQNLGVAPGDILHVGDNFQSDFAMPRLAGWAAQHLPIPHCEEQARDRDERKFLDGIGGADL